MHINISKILSNSKERQYIVNLQKGKSLLALISCFLSLFFAIYAITSGLILYAKSGETPIELFRYFTIDANALMAFASAMIIPYAIDGYRKKRFYCPNWMFNFYYTGTVCTTLTMLVATFAISRVDMEMAFGGYNFYLHIVCPLMILVAFFLIESHFKFTVKDALYTLIPILSYSLIYFYKAMVIGENAGGWEDMYYLKGRMPVFFLFIILIALSFFIAVILCYLYNKLNELRKKKFVSRLWDENVSPVEIKVEIFGLGRYFGKKEYKSHVTIPLDILTIISNKYKIKIEELILAFNRGMLDSMNEKNAVK